MLDLPCESIGGNVSPHPASLGGENRGPQIPSTPGMKPVRALVRLCGCWEAVHVSQRLAVVLCSGCRNGSSRDPILLCWYLGFKQFRGSVSSREPVGVAGVAVGFSLAPETCLQFLHLCSETRALPEQHGRNPVREVPAHFPEMKGLRRKIFPQFISRPCDLL